LLAPPLRRAKQDKKVWHLDVARNKTLEEVNAHLTTVLGKEVVTATLAEHISALEVAANKFKKSVDCYLKVQNKSDSDSMFSRFSEAVRGGAALKCELALLWFFESEQDPSHLRTKVQTEVLALRTRQIQEKDFLHKAIFDRADLALRKPRKSAPKKP
jgi:hypothetical protein